MSKDNQSTETLPSPIVGLGTLVSGWTRRSARAASLAALAVGVAAIMLVASPRSVAASELNATASPTVSATVTAQAVIGDLGSYAASIARRFLGYRYSWGGISPSTGFDCSGFTYYVYKTAGHPISRSLYYQRWSGWWVSKYSLRPGDLVFFQNTYGAGLSHVGMYIGSGYFINAQSESVGVAIRSIWSYYWSSHYLTARRIGY